MKIKELIEILEDLKDPDAIIDMASDEEGNSFGDISLRISEGILQNTKEKAYSLYPKNTELAEERYQ